MPEPTFHATDSGATDAVRRGNRLRLRSATATLGTVGLLTAVVLLAPWRGPTGVDALTPARDPAPRPAPSGAASGLPGSTPTPSPKTPEQAPLAPASPAAALGSPSPVPTSVPSATSAVRTSPITRSTSTIRSDDLCQEDPTAAAAGWCLRYTGPATARRGHPVALSQALCRLGTHPAATVTFRTTREALLSVSGGAADWAAGQGERYTSPGRTVTVPPGTCLVWTSSWDTRGRDGFLVTPGTYDVAAGVESTDLALPSTSTTLRVTD
jgi:hypothetical protein